MQKESSIDNTIAGPDTVGQKIYRTKFFYNSSVSSRSIDALLTKKSPAQQNNIPHIVRSRTIFPSVRSGDSKVFKTRDTSAVSDRQCVTLKQSIETCDSKSHPVCAVDRGGQVGDSASKSSANIRPLRVTTMA